MKEHEIVLRHMVAQDKFIQTFAKNDQALTELCTAVIARTFVRSSNHKRKGRTLCTV